jgi:hypothetical protein
VDLKENLDPQARNQIKKLEDIKNKEIFDKLA